MSVVMWAALVYSDGERSFDRYQSIIDRQMFGRPPAGFDPTKPPSEVSKKKKGEELTKEQEQIRSAVHFSVINVTPEGDTAVGFTDKSDSKSPRHYYLKVGEVRDGWTVVDADAAKAWMKIVKDGVEIELKLGGDSAKNSGATTRAGTPMTLEARDDTPVAERNALLGGSLRQRRLLRQKREEADRVRREAEKRKMEESRLEIQEQLQQLKEETQRAREMADKAAAAAARGKEEGNAENNAEPVQE
jgi:hypothetical protein